MPLRKSVCLITFTILFVPGLSLSAGPTSHLNARNYAQNTPGYDHLQDGARAYLNEDYRRAYGNFIAAARWADKVAQAQLGHMYFLGQGVERNPARGWAWMALAAERDYPQYAAVAREFWANLTSGQQRAALAIYEQELQPEFGDDVAVPRASMRMTRDRMRITGSRVGNISFARTIVNRPGDYFNDTYISADTFYARDRWDFERIIAFEARLFQERARGRVELKELEIHEPDDAEPPR